MKHLNKKIVVENKNDYFFLKRKFNLDSKEIKLIKGAGVNLKKYKFKIHNNSKIVLLPARVIKEKGIINIGGKSQSVYHFVKNYDKKIKKTSINSNTQMPLKQTMDTSKLKKLLSKK